MIAGVVLAAGASRRFGAQKLAAVVAGKPVVRWTVERVCASAVDEVIVVVAPGPDAEPVRSALGGLTVRFVANPHAAEGLAASLGAGIAALTPETVAAVIALGDQPAIDTAVIDRSIAVWHATRTPIVAPSYRGMRGNPVLFARSVFVELLGVRGDQGARDVIARDPRRVALVAVDQPMPLDVDEPASLNAVARHLTRDA